jgi:pantoate--beta-alanine ligase
MEVVRTIPEMARLRGRFPALGLVPTMGFLHDGHLGLVRRAKADCGAVAVSIFVNPMQFGPAEDFSRYPRDADRDLALLAAESVDLVFLPGVADILPADRVTTVDVGPVADRLEGAIRPGHFRGVATIVCKLLNIVVPTRSYFGQKDWQQTVVVRTMARDLNLPGEIVVCPTTREADGLAMSSRNVYLTPDERAAAPTIHRALSEADARYRAGERRGAALSGVVRDVLATEPRFAVEYVSVAHPDSLAELDLVAGDGAVLLLAARLGATRLIDNIRLGA